MTIPLLPAPAWAIVELICSSPIPLPRICSVVPLFSVIPAVAVPFWRMTRPLPVCQIDGRTLVDDVLNRSVSPATAPVRKRDGFDAPKLENTRLFRSNAAPELNVDV